MPRDAACIRVHDDGVQHHSSGVSLAFGEMGSASDEEAEDVLDSEDAGDSGRAGEVDLGLDS